MVGMEVPNHMIADATGITSQLYTSIFSHVTDGNVNQFLFPLLVLFDYINPPVTVFYKLLFENDRACYIESLHDTWIVSASGLRAPPYEFDL